MHCFNGPILAIYFGMMLQTNCVDLSLFFLSFPVLEASERAKPSVHTLRDMSTIFSG